MQESQAWGVFEVYTLSADGASDNLLKLNYLVHEKSERKLIFKFTRLQMRVSTGKKTIDDNQLEIDIVTNSLPTTAVTSYNLDRLFGIKNVFYSHR